MKFLKTILTILILLPSLSYGQNSNNSTIQNILNYINTEVAKYNKYGANFDVEGKSLVFANKFGAARIPFHKIDFRIDEASNSIDVFCLDQQKCIEMYDDKGASTSWIYYNISMPYNDGMAKSAYTVFEKFKELKNIVESNKITFNSESTSDLLSYINRKFSQYNKYNSKFDVDQASKRLIFKNEFGTARIRFMDIDFKINEKTKSIDVYCLDGSKCIDKYDEDGDLTTWDYYNVSMPVPDGDKITNEAYIVLEKCKKLKRNILNPTQNTNNTFVDEGESIDGLLNYINAELAKYNKYDSRLSVDGDKLIFKNQFGRADIPFQAIDFKIDEKTKSIDIFCINGSKCIEKYDDSNRLTTWDYYNISMPDGEEMAATAKTVLSKCKALKNKALE